MSQLEEDAERMKIKKTLAQWLTCPEGIKILREAAQKAYDKPRENCKLRKIYEKLRESNERQREVFKINEPES